MVIEAFVQQVDNTNNKAVLLATIPFLDLLGVVRESYRKNDRSDGEYQRRIEKDRVSNIAKYIYNCFTAQVQGASKTLFPTSIILASNNEDISISSIHVGDIIKTTIPSEVLIVDGQHRFLGMKALYDKLRKELFDDDIKKKIGEYRFSCSILINHDMWEQATIFVDVNFNQRKVNKSLFYDIYGVMLPDENIIPKQNKIYIAHSIVDLLQNKDKSVLQGYIKMLGKEPGWVSQAFLVEALIPHMRPMGIWSFAVESYRENKRVIYCLFREVTALFAALKFVFPQFWPQGSQMNPSSVLCKTTGMGASIQLLSDLHLHLQDDIKNSIESGELGVTEYAEMITEFSRSIKKLDIYSEELFSLDKEKGKFAGTGGKGLQNNLYKRMKHLIYDA